MIDEPVTEDEPTPDAPPSKDTRRAPPRPMSSTRDSDLAVRPGFRSPANARSKAQKKGKKKR